MTTFIQLFKSRTILFAMTLAILSVAQGYIFLLQISPFHQMIVGICVSVVVTVLRMVTTMPVSEK